jgi:dTDP-4-amino-4,6-dideoxygalactose transaminase
VHSLQTPLEPEWSRSNYHLYVVACAEGRDDLQGYFAQQNIGSGLHYPIPLHLQTAYAYLGCTEGSLPETEMQAKRTLSLPMYPQLKREQQERVAEVIHQFCETQTLGRNIA